jgi:outer membrane protein OmpA-like peptidoglycan-associated protein
VFTLSNFKEAFSMANKSTFTPVVAVLCAVTLLVAGCANPSPEQKGAAMGAGLGALAGVLLGDSTKSATIGAAVGALGGYVWSKNMEEKKQAMEKATAGTGVLVTQTPDNQLKLNIPSDISFDSGRYNIKPNLQPVLDQFAQGLNGQPNTELRIVGHTDSTGSDTVNNSLSINRAGSARDYLVSKGVDSRRIATEGHGAKQPLADNASEAGRAKNRRIEIYLAERQPAKS